MADWIAPTENEARIVLAEERSRFSTQRKRAALLAVGLMIAAAGFAMKFLEGSVADRAEQILGYPPDTAPIVVLDARDDTRITDVSEETTAATAQGTDAYENLLGALEDFQEDAKDSKKSLDERLREIDQETSAGKWQATREVYVQSLPGYLVAVALIAVLYVAYFIYIAGKIARYRKNEYVVAHGKYTKKREVRLTRLYYQYYLTIALEDETTLEAEVTRSIFRSVTFQSDVIALRMQGKDLESGVRAFIVS